MTTVSTPLEGKDFSDPEDHAPPAGSALEARTIPTTCIETIGGDPATAIRLSFQIKVF